MKKSRRKSRKKSRRKSRKNLMKKSRKKSLKNKRISSKNKRIKNDGVFEKLYKSTKDPLPPVLSSPVSPVEPVEPVLPVLPLKNTKMVENLVDTKPGVGYIDILNSMERIKNKAAKQQRQEYNRKIKKMSSDKDKLFEKEADMITEKKDINSRLISLGILPDRYMEHTNEKNTPILDIEKRNQRVPTQSYSKKFDGTNKSWRYVIPYEMVLKYYVAYVLSSLPIISIGSGTGEFENYLEDKTGKEIICVDPTPTEYESGEWGLFKEAKKDRKSDKEIKIFKKPDYKNVDELIADKKDIVGNCSIMIIWPYPDPNGNYDMNAIKKLNPSRVLLLYSRDGHSGSDALREYIYRLPDKNKYNAINANLTYPFSLYDTPMMSCTLEILSRPGDIDMYDPMSEYSIRANAELNKSLLKKLRNKK